MPNGVARQESYNRAVEGSGKTLRQTATPSEPKKGKRTAPYLFRLFEASQPLAGSARHCLEKTSVVTVGRGEVREFCREDAELALRVPDRWMSSQHATLENRFGRWLLQDTNSKNGVRVNGKPTTRHELQDHDQIELGHTFFLFRENLELVSGPPDVNSDEQTPPLAGWTTLVPELWSNLQNIAKIADTDVSLMILGESGTGKEVLARAVHNHSKRSGSFVAVNCGAIPETLVESELFGHKKGAFSGAASDKPGLVRSANAGTLFLDEIGDLPLASQAAFLRVLQESEVRPVGATQSISVDIRLISATHADLDGDRDSETFRQDLFARIAGFRVDLPRLRDRTEDIGILLAILLQKVAPNRPDITFDIDAARVLLAYRWPLNIRELENCLTTAVVLADGDMLELEHFPAEVRTPSRTGSGISAPFKGEQEQHRREIEELLREHKGNVSAVARATGKDRKQIQRWIKRYRLRAADYRR